MIEPGSGSSSGSGSGSDEVRRPIALVNWTHRDSLTTHAKSIRPTTTSSVEKQPGGFKPFDVEPPTDLLGGRPARPHVFYSKELHKKANLDPVVIPISGWYVLCEQALHRGKALLPGAQVTKQPRFSLGFWRPERHLPTLTPRLPLKHLPMMLRPSPHAHPRLNHPSKH